MQSDKIDALAAALVKVQANLKAAVKDSVNPFFRSGYADLNSVWEACRKPLAENGLAVFQGCEHHDGADFLTTTLMHTSGQWIKSELHLLLEKQTAQGMGSAITYARRYSLAAAIGIIQEDDDGNAATHKSFTQEAREQAADNGQKADAVSMQKAGIERANTIVNYVDAGLFSEDMVTKALAKYKASGLAQLPKDVADKMIAACIEKENALNKRK